MCVLIKNSIKIVLDDRGTKFFSLHLPGMVVYFDFKMLFLLDLVRFMIRC